MAKKDLDFNHLVDGFDRCFHGSGFDSEDFEKRERGYKEKAARKLRDELGQGVFENLRHNGRCL
jgi:hypothetical protein